MPRGLTTEIKARIAEQGVYPVYLAHFDFDGAAVRTWTGQGDLSYDSQTWSSDSVVIRWPAVTESVDLVAHNITVELSRNFDYTVDIADATIYRARLCEIYIGFLEADGTLPSTNVYKVFSGRMAVVGYVDDGENDAYSLVAESRLVDLQKAKAVRYTHQSQLQRFAGDKGLEYAGAAQRALFIGKGDAPDQPYSRKVVYGTTPVDGSVVFIATSGSASRYLNLVVAFADHECEGIDQLWLDDRAVLSGGSVAGEFVGVVDYYAHLGTDTQTVETALQTEVGSTVWTSNHRLRGITYVYLRILYSEELFGTDAPGVSALIRGKKLYDPRSATTVFSDNSALVVRDYLLSENYGFSAGSADVDDATVAVAANDCDALIARADGTTEKRYTSNGVLDTAVPIGENLKLLLDAMAGKVSYMGGVFSIYAGVYSLTSLPVTDGELVEEIDFRNLNLREAFNGARGLYRTPDLDWQEEDYPSYQNAAALTADGEDRWMDLPLPLTTSAARCQRIAKINVMRSRAARTVTLNAMLKVLDVRAGDVIVLDTSRNQLETALYEVRALSIVLDLAPRVDLELLEVAESDYAWDESTEEVELTAPEEPADSILAWTLARLAAPSATPGSLTYVADFDVTVSHNETGVDVYYTTDGSDPTASDTSIADGGTISLSASTVTLKIKSFQTGGSLTSETVTYDYTYQAPTVFVPEPDYRWDWFEHGTDADNNYPRLSYAISGLASCDLYNSENGGSAWTLLQAATVDGTYYTASAEVPQGWTPSDYRAYGEKAAYLDSNPVVLPAQCIPPLLWGQNAASGDWFKPLGIQCFGTNCSIFHRHSWKNKSSGTWSAWSSWTEVVSNGWGDIIGTRFPNISLESEFLHRKYEVYVAQSGFADSTVMYINSETRDIIYGGEGGVVIDPSFIYKPNTYS